MGGQRTCSYPKCNHKRKTHACKLHAFPKDPDRCRLWLTVCGLSGSPRSLPFTRCVCSCHFVGALGPTEEHPNPVPVRVEAQDDCDMDDDDWETTRNAFTDSPCEPLNPPANVTCADNQDNDDCREPPQEMRSSSSERNAHYLNSPAHSAQPHSGSLRENQEKIRDLKVRVTEIQVLVERLEDGNKLEEVQDSLLLSLRAFKDVVESLQGRGNVGDRPNQDDILDDVSTCTDSASEGELAVRLPPTPDAANSRGSNDPSEEAPNPQVEEITHARDLRGNNFRSRKRMTSGSRSSRRKRRGETGPFLSYSKGKRMCEDDFRFVTGLSQEDFEALYQFLGGDEVCEHLKYEYDSKTPAKEMSKLSLHTPRDRLFMTLVRLRRGVPLRDLGFIVNLSEGTVSRTCYTWIRLMSEQFKQLEEAMFVSASAQQENTPDCFRPFPNLRAIIDGTEIKIQKPDDMDQQSNTFSSYKGCNTVKFLVAISVYGGLSFLSEAFEGSISDKNLFLKSGIMDHLTPGDAVMSDRGFDVEAELNDFDCHLLIPSFLEQRTHFTPSELALSKAIASSRVHVERFIGRVKEFRILRFGIPNNMLPIVSDIFRVCACLVNFQAQLIV